jgi:hypothetical protein
MPLGGGYLEVQCSDLFCILAYRLLLQALGDIHSQRALAKVLVAKLIWLKNAYFWNVYTDKSIGSLGSTPIGNRKKWHFDSK